ncbi:MerR family transcriptional regulator [Micromonospora sonneratiae]|uniref:MerR family transcriptional regulator n=1 Tax=Micromonospora sonneratiae TaxID=1184706 RepID=A0ABW3YG93_9ACTN
MSELLTTGEFGAQSRLSPKALRLYEQRSLLLPAHIDARTGYRYYGPAELDRARRIVLLRGIGMPLADIAAVLDLPPAPADRVVDAYWQRVEADHTARRSLVAHLRQVLTEEGVHPMYDIRQRDVPEQKVIFIQRHVTADQLPVFLPEATRQLFAHLDAVGGTLSGPVFVVYHGLVSEDSDGPVEVCAPTPDPIEPVGAIGVRVEGAHREAYTALTRTQASYPSILGAYDAVGAWLTDRSLTLSASVREVYYPNWDTADDAEECVDVAFPFSSR